MQHSTVSPSAQNDVRPPPPCFAPFRQHPMRPSDAADDGGGEEEGWDPKFLYAWRDLDRHGTDQRASSCDRDDGPLAYSLSSGEGADDGFSRAGTLAYSASTGEGAPAPPPSGGTVSPVQHMSCSRAASTSSLSSAAASEGSTFMTLGTMEYDDTVCGESMASATERLYRDAAFSVVSRGGGGNSVAPVGGAGDDRNATGSIAAGVLDSLERGDDQQPMPRHPKNASSQKKQKTNFILLGIFLVFVCASAAIFVATSNKDQRQLPEFATFSSTPNKANFGAAEDATDNIDGSPMEQDQAIEQVSITDADTNFKSQTAMPSKKPTSHAPTIPPTNSQTPMPSMKPTSHAPTIPPTQHASIPFSDQTEPNDPSEEIPCGDGARGNGRCPNLDHCCSSWGWCGPGPGYCGRH